MTPPQRRRSAGRAQGRHARAAGALAASTGLAAVLVAGCGDDAGPDPAPDPVAALCRDAFPRGTVTHAFATTVGEVRARGAGPGLRPAATAWPGRADTDAAAWCYLDSDGQRTAAAATAGEAPVTFATGNFSASPDGPRIP